MRYRGGSAAVQSKGIAAEVGFGLRAGQVCGEEEVRAVLRPGQWRCVDRCGQPQRSQSEQRSGHQHCRPATQPHAKREKERERESESESDGGEWE